MMETPCVYGLRMKKMGHTSKRVLSLESCMNSGLQNENKNKQDIYYSPFSKSPVLSISPVLLIRSFYTM